MAWQQYKYIMCEKQNKLIEFMLLDSVIQIPYKLILML